VIGVSAPVLHHELDGDPGSDRALRTE